MISHSAVVQVSRMMLAEEPKEGDGCASLSSTTMELIETTFVTERSSNKVVSPELTTVIMLAIRTWCLALSIETIALLIRHCVAVNKDVVTHAISQLVL